MDQDISIFDNLIDLVRDNPDRLSGILEANSDIREELDPILKTASWINRVAHPEMTHDNKLQYRHLAITNGASHLEESKGT